jgi:hypothetical protein
VSLYIRRKNRQDDGKVTALVPRLLKRAKNKETREEQKREQNKIYTRLTSLYF